MKRLPLFFYFYSLRTRLSIPKSATFKSYDPLDITKVLIQADSCVQAVRAFPFYVVNELYNKCRKVSSIDDPEANKVSVLFMHEQILSDKKVAQALHVCLRDAWLTLCERPDVLSALYDLLCVDREYEQAILRFTGASFAVGQN
jgi:hypothetical protein